LAAFQVITEVKPIVKKGNGVTENTEDVKQCPFCAETLSTEALKCRFCGEYLNPFARDISALMNADSWWKRKKAERSMWGKVKSQEWLRTTLLLVNRMMNSASYRRKHPFASILQTQASKEFRELVACEIAGPLIEIAMSENQTIACRHWLVALCKGYAPLRVMFTEPRYTTEQAAGVEYHPCISGLYESIEDLIRLRYPDEYAKVGNMELLKETLRTKGIQFNFYVMVATNARCALGDEPAGRDWLSPLFNSMCALMEDAYRADLNLPRLGDSGEILTEQLTIQANVVGGLKDPLAGVRFARALRR
jgi:hypothetical protein